MSLFVQSSRIRAWCLVLAFLAWCLSAATASGQQQDWISMWAFNGQPETAVRNRLTSEYEMQLVMIDRVCELDPSQSKKLESAARLELNRFFRDVARVRRKLSEMNVGNQNVQEAWTVVSPIATKIQNGLFKDGALFQKVVHAVLSERQQRQYAEEIEKNRRRRWRAITRVNVAEMEKSMPLLDSQRTELLTLLDQQAIPPKFARQMDGYAGYFKLCKVDEAELAKVLDKEQMEVVEQFRQRFQGFGMMFQ